MLATYHAHQHAQEEPLKLGWVPPLTDLHGRITVNGEMVPIIGGEKPVVSGPREIARVIEAGKPFEVDEKAEPHLADHVRSDHRFQVHRQRVGGHRNIGTRAGSGI